MAVQLSIIEEQAKTLELFLSKLLAVQSKSEWRMQQNTGGAQSCTHDYTAEQLLTKAEEKHQIYSWSRSISCKKP